MPDPIETLIGEELPADPYRAIALLYSWFLSELEMAEWDPHFAPDSDATSSIEARAIEGLALMQAIAESALGIQTSPPPEEENLALRLVRIRDCVESIDTEASKKAATHHILAAKERYRALIAGGTPYHINESDLQRIQTLLNELRDLIENTDQLDEGHKRRLLRRLERLQREMHESLSNVDRLWGFILDAATVIGAVGDKMKPIFERLEELAAIIWRVETDAKGLPQLPQPIQLQLPSKPENP